MKKATLIILLLLTACDSNQKSGKTALIKKTPITFPFGDTTFSWKGIEKQNDSLKTRFIKLAFTLFKNEHEIYRDGESAIKGYYEKDFRAAFHVIDINNDGLDDFIYTGSTGGEGFEVAVILNTPKGFKVILKQAQYIRKMEFENHKLLRLYIQDTGCCAAYLYFNKIYEAYYNGTQPEFKTIYLTSNTMGTYFPKRYFDNPFYFEVLNNNYKMREEPVIDDTAKSSMMGTSYLGNNIDTLNKGTRGRAIASQTDKTGRIWWLVEIDRNYKSYGNLFYEPGLDTAERAGKIGWISSRFVKKLNN